MAYSYRIFLHWMVLAGVIAFTAVVAWHHGLFHILFMSDRSRISLVITIIFLFTSVHAARRAYQLSVELNALDGIKRLFDTHAGDLPQITDGQQLTFAGQLLPEGLANQHILNLLQRFPVGQLRHDAPLEQNRLLDILERRVNGAQELGWLVADLMLKLGLLGTVIGFILMLGSVNTVSDFDVATMQVMLQDMSSGMRVALFTTFSGLVGGMLLTLQYHLVQRGADELVAHISEVSELRILPYLQARSEDEATAGN